MPLEPIQTLALLGASSAIAFLLAFELRGKRASNDPDEGWRRIAQECGLGVLTGGFVSLAAVAVGGAFRGAAFIGTLEARGSMDLLSLACVLGTLALMCSERGSWAGNRPATLLAAVVPWLLIPELGESLGVRLPAEMLGLTSAAVYRVVLSGAHASRISTRARQAAVEATGDGVLVVDSEGRLVEANSVGREAFESLATTTRQDDSPTAGDEPRLPRRVRALLAKPASCHFSLRNSSDRVFEIWLGSAESHRKADSYRALIVRDISERRRGENHLLRIAHYDSLTGLANRRLFIDHLERAIRDAKQSNAAVALIYIDLDRFKEINDTLGHGAGDELLRVIARRFQEQVQADYPARLQGPKPASVARLGGDEFAIIIPSPENAKEVEAFARQLLLGMNEPLTLAGREVASSGSIGIAVYPHDGEDVETLVKHADSALYGAKRLGRNRSQRYQPEFSREADRTQAIEHELRGAIDRNEFQLHYQPKIDVATDTAAGFEALIRWKSKELGNVSPDEFIPIAEERGLISKIGAWCLKEACQQIRRWRDAGYEPVPVAVNVSSAQFLGSNLPELVRRALTDAGIESGLLELELTERLLLEDNEQTASCLAEIRELGVSLALDDFGTGYSALTYLNRFPLDVLKMDRGLLLDLETSDSAAGIAAAVVSMCHSLGLKVVAEGVDAEGQLEILREMSCDQIQGFLFSPALETADVCQLLAAQGEPRPVLTPKPAVVEVPTFIDDDSELDIEADGWESSLIDSAPSPHQLLRALLINSSESTRSLIPRLEHLGVRVHEISTQSLDHDFVAPGNGQIDFVVVGTDVNLYSARAVLDALEIQGNPTPSVVVVGEKPTGERREAIRELGASWALWTPFDDADLRFLVRAVTPAENVVIPRNEIRIPMDAMAWIRARARRDVGVLSSLSRRGAFIETAEPLETGSSMRLEFEIPAGRISTFAKVVYQQRASGESATACVPGMGVTFYGLDPASEMSIGELVDANSAKFRP